jgi:hypothetical protein
MSLFEKPPPEYPVESLVKHIKPGRPPVPRPTGNITPHFRWDEFLRPEDPVPPHWVLNNLKQLAAALEVMRGQLGNHPITIGSGYRTVAHNREIGGRKASFHLLGMAADITHAVYRPGLVQAMMTDWPGGMGQYPTFTHFDIRPYKARWRVR